MFSIISIFLNEGTAKGLACLLIFCIGKIVYKFEYPDYKPKELLSEMFSEGANTYRTLMIDCHGHIGRKIVSAMLAILATLLAFVFRFIVEPDRVFPIFLIPFTPLIVEHIYQQSFAALLGA
ncbi:hypothetical protein [Rubneribacter sp.]